MLDFLYFSLHQGLAADQDPFKAEQDLGETKNKARQLFRRIDRNSAAEACIESGRFNI